MKLAELCDQPRELRWYLRGWEPSPLKVGWLGRLMGKTPEPPPPARAPWQEPLQEDTQYLDKAWHAIHFLLCGSPDSSDHPLAFLLSGRTIHLGDADVIVHHANEVHALDEALGAVDRAWLATRWDQPEMVRQGVYLIEDCDPDDADIMEYVFAYALELVEFVHVAAERKCGLVVDIAG